MTAGIHSTVRVISAQFVRDPELLGTAPTGFRAMTRPPDDSGFRSIRGRFAPLMLEMEPENGGFLRVWRNGGKLPAPFVCAGAGVRGWCDVSFHSSISSEREWRMVYKILGLLVFAGLWQMEQRIEGEIAAWL